MCDCGSVPTMPRVYFRSVGGLSSRCCLTPFTRLASGPPEGCDQERLQQAAGEGEVGLEPGDEVRAFWNRLQNVAEPGASHGPVPAGVDVDREENVAAESVTIREGTIKELGLEK